MSRALVNGIMRCKAGGPIRLVFLAMLGSGACGGDSASPDSPSERRSAAPDSAQLTQALREFTCTPELESACAAYGAQCVDNACDGGYAPGHGCSQAEEEACARYGTHCVDHQCSGGYGAGTGCTAREQLDCAAFGTHFVNHQCSGGYGAGTGCTAREELNCAAFGTHCVDHACSGGFGAGTGCTAREQLDCAEGGCGCADHACAGGSCPGQDCTAREQIDCAERGLDCAGHQCVCDREGGACGTNPVLPMAPEPCKPLTTGMHTILGTTVHLWVGARSEQQRGPIYISWHGTGASGADAMTALGAFGAEILGAGGVIAAPVGTTGNGMSTGNATWYTGDFAIADYVVACAAEQLNIDARRIWTGGDASGGLQAGAMVYWRSTYLAAAITNSGGAIPGTAAFMFQGDRAAPVLTMHGAKGSDMVVIDFSETSLGLCRNVVGHGGFAIDCDHGGGHAAAPPELRASAFEFLKAHPFGVAPEPYAGGLPATFPSFCKIIGSEECQSSAECAAGSACVDGKCKVSCGAAGNHCTGDSTCIDGECVAPCASDEDCPAGTACFDSACRAGCGSVGVYCPAEHTCLAGVCVAACVSDADCPAGTTCVGGACIAP